MVKMSKKGLAKNDLREAVAIVMGTRPGIVKMTPLVKEFSRRGVENFIIHTGQHYSTNMDAAFFEDLELPQPRHRVDSTRNYSTHAGQTAEMMTGVERVLIETRPKVVLVCGDANTNLAAGLATRKLGLIVGHVESGLRSHDWTMPEEHNRIILDHISELLFAPTEETCRNLVMDNVRGEIHLTGNTIVDSTLEGINIAARKAIAIEQFGVDSNSYILCTSHREENVDNPARLNNILSGIRRAATETGLHAIFPVHPRTKKRMVEFGLLEGLLKENVIKVIEPVGYLEFLMLIKNAALILTDSGGIQEEACILHTPCVTLRDNTERPDTLGIGSNALAGTMPDDIVAEALRMMRLERSWPIPFGDGKAAVRIANIVESVVNCEVHLADVRLRSRTSYKETFRLVEL